MSQLRDLYQEVILDHGRSPRNFRAPERCETCTCHKAEGHNPLCGDRVTVWVKKNDDKVTDISFKGAGCAICLASASMMTETLCGRSVEECRRCHDAFHELVTGARDYEDDDETLGKLAVFAGVSEFPMRVKCATLAWHTLQAALQKKAEEPPASSATEPS